MQVLSEPFLTKSLVYDRCGFLFENPAAEKESTEYDAFTFDLNGSKVLFRSAKITPKKTGRLLRYGRG